MSRTSALWTGSEWHCNSAGLPACWCATCSTSSPCCAPSMTSASKACSAVSYSLICTTGQYMRYTVHHHGNISVSYTNMIINFTMAVKLFNDRFSARSAGIICAHTCYLCLHFTFFSFSYLRFYFYVCAFYARITTTLKDLQRKC